MVKEKWKIQENNKILRKMAGIIYAKAGKMNIIGSRDFTSKEFQVLFTGAKKDIMVKLLQTLSKRNHTAGMSQTPFKRADEYVFFGIQY
jgi:hypothetical protein